MFTVDKNSRQIAKEGEIETSGRGARYDHISEGAVGELRTTCTDRAHTSTTYSKQARHEQCAENQHLSTLVNTTVIISMCCDLTDNDAHKQQPPFADAIISNAWPS